jgi:hypothetical protein
MSYTEQRTTRQNSSAVTLEDLMKKICEADMNQSLKFGNLEKTLSDISKTQKQLIDTNNELKAEIRSINDKFNLLSKIQTTTNQAVDDLNHTVGQLKYQVNTLKQEKLSQNLVLTGLPDITTTANQKVALIKLAHNIGINIKNSDILSFFKIKTKNSHKHIVKFISQEVRDSILTARKGKSVFSDEIGITTHQRCQIYMHEDLTFATQELKFKTKHALKNYGYKHIWTKNGVILTTKDLTIKPVRITSEEFLLKLCQIAEEQEIDLNSTVIET